MQKLLFLQLLLLLSPDLSFGSFERTPNLLSHPVFGVYSFLPSNFIDSRQYIFTTSGSRLYSMSECNDANISLLTTFPCASFGIDASFFGSELYNETVLGLSVLKGSTVLVGMKLKIMKLGIQNYGTRFYASDDLIFISRYAPFYTQCVYSNALSYGYTYSEEKPVGSFSSLLKVYLADWTSFNIQITYGELTGTEFEIGNGLKLSDLFSCGGGFNIQTHAITATILANLKWLDLTYAVMLHPELGLTHRGGLIISKLKNQNNSKETNDGNDFRAPKKKD